MDVITSGSLDCFRIVPVRDPCAAPCGHVADGEFHAEIREGAQSHARKTGKGCACPRIETSERSSGGAILVDEKLVAFSASLCAPSGISA